MPKIRARSFIVRSLIVITLVLSGSHVANAVTVTDADSATREALCQRPENATLKGSPRLTEEGYLEGEAWIAGENGQAAVRALNARLDRERSQVLGVIPDHDQRRVLVVVDSGTSSAEYMEQLDSEVAAVAPELRPQVRPSCHPRGPLDATVERLRSTSKDLGIKGPFGFTISAATATVEIVADSPDDAATMQQEFGDTVTILPGRPSEFQGSRTSDSSPHYGDAKITTGWSPCSSNFSFVSNAYGTQVTATAGHCGSGSWYSGANLVGDTIYWSSNPDVEMLYAAGQNHTNQIYTTPGSPTTRSVTSKHNLTLNEYTCAGGYVTESDCGAYVTSTAYYQCISGVCRNYVQIFRLSDPGDYICNHGDSGGVIYQRSGSSNAIANGMINAGTVDGGGVPLYGFGGYDCWTTPISQIESTLNVSLKITP